MTPSGRESGLARPAAAGRSVPFSKASQCCRRRRSTPPEILGREPALSPCFQRNSGPMNCRQGTPIQLPVEASDLNVSGFLTISKAIRRAFFPCPADRSLSPKIQLLPVQTMEGLRQKLSIFSDQLTIKPDLAASMIATLDTHHVPVHL